MSAYLKWKREGAGVGIPAMWIIL